MSTVSQERYFLFHLPQCVYCFHSDGRDVLEASWSFIVRRITGLFCSLCTDFISLLRKFPFIHPFSQFTTKRITLFFFFLLIFPFYSPQVKPSFLLPWKKLPDSKLYAGHSQISFINFVLSITQILILHSITFLNVLLERLPTTKIEKFISPLRLLNFTRITLRQRFKMSNSINSTYWVSPTGQTPVNSW